jgi:hypothetical protein
MFKIAFSYDRNIGQIKLKDHLGVLQEKKSEFIFFSSNFFLLVNKSN